MEEEARSLRQKEIPLPLPRHCPPPPGASLPLRCRGPSCVHVPAGPLRELLLQWDHDDDAGGPEQRRGEPAVQPREALVLRGLPQPSQRR